MASNGRRRERPADSECKPSIPYRINQFIQRPTEERAQHKIRETSVTVYTRCNISIAVSLRAWCLSRVCCSVFCIRRRSLRGIGAMIVIAQSG